MKFDFTYQIDRWNENHLRQPDTGELSDAETSRTRDLTTFSTSEKQNCPSPTPTAHIAFQDEHISNERNVPGCSWTSWGNDHMGSTGESFSSKNEGKAMLTLRLLWITDLVNPFHCPRVAASFLHPFFCFIPIHLQRCKFQVSKDWTCRQNYNPTVYAKM